MKHIKTVKDERGKFDIEVSLWIPRMDWETDINGNKFRYDIHVLFTPKGKRKPIHGNSFEMVRNIDIIKAKQEFWKLLEPKGE